MKEIREIRFNANLSVEAYRFQGIMQAFPNHFHEYYVVGFIENGSRSLRYDNKTYTVQAGDIVLLNPYETHACVSLDGLPLDYRCFNIYTEGIEALLKGRTDKGKLPRFHGPVISDSPLVEALRQTHKALMDEKGLACTETAFHHLLGQMLDRFTRRPGDRWEQEGETPVQLVCKHMEEHLAESITLDQMAAMAGFSKSYFIRVFTKQMGITPYCYLETLRINQAKKLLEKGMPQIDAALQTGFTDQSHFHHFFKALIGLTPRQYQNIFRENKCPARVSGKKA